MNRNDNDLAQLVIGTLCILTIGMALLWGFMAAIDALFFAR